MNRSALNLKLSELIAEWNNYESAQQAYDVLLEMKTLLETYLAAHPCDVETIVQLALTVFTVPCGDDPAAIEYLTEALRCDQKNFEILLMLAYIQHVYCGVSPKVFSELQSVSPANAEQAAMLFYAQSWYYRRDDKHQDLYLACLEKSVASYDKYVWPHYYLGLMYYEKGHYEEACNQFKGALESTKSVFTDKNFYHIIDINALINERIKGYCITDVNKDRIRQLIADCASESINKPALLF